MIPLPKIGKPPVNNICFPTVHQEFIFRASEFVSFEKMAALLKTDPEKVKECARQMGIYRAEESDVWLRKGYISVIRAMWHVLPYDQLAELLETDPETLAVTLREEDFLDVKLSDKPDCPRVEFAELTESELAETGLIKEAMDSLSEDGVKPFDFRPVVPDTSFGGRELFGVRMIYLFSGLYQSSFDVASESFCSDEMLESYRRSGINGIWTQGILYRMTRFPFAPELSSGWEKRLENLKRFTERLKKFGIKLYLYLNEPRSMPSGFFEKYPGLAGHAASDEKVCMCTSVPEVRQWIKDAVETVCAAAPEIGGFFTITRSENLTNCYSHSNPQTCSCPRCKNRTVGEVIGEVISCFREGADRVNREIKVFAWSWAWNARAGEVIANLPERVILMAQSEKDAEYDIGGVKGTVVDYSMGQIGPSGTAKEEWKAAKKRGLETAAKVQINTTWEGSTVPALPLTPLIEEHLRRIRDEGVGHLLLSWTLGGYPSENLTAASKFFFENANLPERSPLERRACELFSKAFKEFPFSLRTLYLGPQNAGPANPLWEKPTGYGATMTCFSYDDLEKWRGPYPVGTFEDQLAKLCGLWEQGLALMDGAPDTETKLMAKAAYCLYRSSLSQVRFIRARDAGNKAAMSRIAAEEEQTAREMLDCMNKNAAIGFEAANQYYFTKRALAEKIVNCRRLCEKLG